MENCNEDFILEIAGMKLIFKTQCKSLLQTDIYNSLIMFVADIIQDQNQKVQ